MIVAAYPCTGKSTLASECWKTCIDLETSNFDKSNPCWAEYYTNVAIDLYNQSRFTRHIFVSTHPGVIDALKIKDQSFLLVFPALSLEDTMIKRAESRLELNKAKLKRYMDKSDSIYYGSEYEKKVNKMNMEISKNERALYRIRDHYEEDIESLMKYDCDKFIFSDPDFYLNKLFGNN